MYGITLGHTRHRFRDLKHVMAAASPLRSGDQLAGLAADSAEQRIAARMVLAEVPLRQFLDTPLVPYEADEVTRLICDRHDAAAFAPIAGFTVGQFRDWLLNPATAAAALAAVAPGVTPEMAAAVSKLMRNQDLIGVAARLSVVTRFRTTLGLPGRMASRLQPNHPTDDPAGIAASLLDGLTFGIGDAVIGINPATDSLDSYLRLTEMLDALRQRFAIPVQGCVLGHVTTAIDALAAGAPVDLVFQSIAGSEAANRGFGISLALLDDAAAAMAAAPRPDTGPNRFYFETGQGSAPSASSPGASAHHDVDQQTMEARAYAVARRYSPLLVNTVVGFIGPEYLYDGKQIIRAGLEDVFCGKLLGVPMGCDVCYTNHAEADQDDMDTLMVLLANAGALFLIAVPGGDDVMLNYQSLSYHDIAALRRLTGLRPAPEFEAWLEAVGISASGTLAPGSAAISGAARALARALLGWSPAA